MPWSPPEVEIETEPVAGDWSPPEDELNDAWMPPEVERPMTEAGLTEFNKRFPKSYLGQPTPLDTTTELTTALAQDMEKPLFHIFPELTPEEQAALKEASPEEQRKAGYAQGTARAVNSLTSPLNLGLLAGTMGLGAGPVLSRSIALGFAVSMGKQVPEIARQLGEQFGLPEQERDQQKIGELIAEGAATTGFTAAAGFGGLKPKPKPGEVAGRMLAGEVKRADVAGLRPDVPPEALRAEWTPPEVEAAPERGLQPASTPAVVSESKRPEGRAPEPEPARPGDAIEEPPTTAPAGQREIFQPKPPDKLSETPTRFEARGTELDEAAPSQLTDPSSAGVTAYPPPRGDWSPLRETPPEREPAAGFPMATGAASAPAPIIPPPAPAPGTTMIQHGYLPVTLPRTAAGSVSVPQIMKSLLNVQRVAGSQAGSIRTGRFYQKALGIFKPHEEIIRLGAADDIPTATHEVGHALQQQLYGTTKATGLRTLPFDVRRELQGMGKALYGSRKPTAGYTGEGFAEFMRYWLSTEDAAKVAPKTTAFFESQVLPKYPDVASALLDARGLMDIWRHQGSVERAQRQLVREPGAFSRIAKALHGLVTYQGQFESGAPLEALSKAAERKLGRPLAPSQDPFKLFSMKRGSAGATVERMAMNNMLDIWGNPVGPSLAEALAPVKNQRKEFGLYVLAKAAEMRWRQGKNPGISLEDAQFIKAQYDSPQFQLAAQKYFDWMNGGLEYLLQADPSMAGVVAKIRGANDFYAPLARLIDPAAARRSAAQARSNPLMRMHGSGLPVKDIFDQSFLHMARLVGRAHKAMVANAVVKLAQIPGLGHLIEEVPRARVMEQFNFEKIRQQLEDAGVDTSAIAPDEMIQYAGLADSPKGSDPIISVKDSAGNTRWFFVEPSLYNSLERLQTFSFLNAFPNVPALGMVLELLVAAPGRALRLGTTGLRAPFSLITNPSRDLQTLLVQTSVNPARVAAEYPAALAGVIREGFGGKGGPNVEAFHNLAAHMGQPLGLDISHTKRVSNQIFHGRVLRVVKNPVDHLRQLFSITEAAPRVAELSAVAKEIGWTPGTKMSPDQAVQMALAAKRVTVDFSAAGDVSRVMNAAVPFYNPSVQGLRSFARAFRDHPGRSALLGTALFTAPALLNWWKNKDQDWYKMLPWRERYTYTNIDDGTNVWRIPRPFEWGNTFQVVPEAILDSWYRRDPEAVKQAMGHVFETTNPLDLPVLGKIAKEQWSNRIAFWDRPIVPRGEEDLPPSAQVGPYTTKLAVAINRAFPNLSPRRVDAALRSYFGGAASDLISALGLGAAQVDREWERSDLPVLGVLFRRGGEFNAQNQAISDFYDAYLPAKAKVDAQKRQVKEAGNPINVTPADYIAADIGANASKAISELLKLANSAKALRARQELYHAAGDVARQANEVITARK